MHDLDMDPVPQGELALKITTLPRDCNSFGDIYGGWLVAQMDVAGGVEYQLVCFTQLS